MGGGGLWGEGCEEEGAERSAGSWLGAVLVGAVVGAVKGRLVLGPVPALRPAADQAAGAWLATPLCGANARDGHEGHVERDEAADLTNCLKQSSVLILFRPVAPSVCRARGGGLGFSAAPPSVSACPSWAKRAVLPAPSPPSPALQRGHQPDPGKRPARIWGGEGGAA
jgi:hypothetical protein